ncbi:MAG: hypothetical protein ACR2NN_18360 [Bryobacteraceae bacterium]
MSENSDRLDRIERIVANLAEGHQIEVQMRHEEMANEREMRQSLAREHYQLSDDVKEQHRFLLRAQIMLTEEVRANTAGIKELKEGLIETGEHLNLLMQMMDNFIRENKKNGSQ